MNERGEADLGCVIGCAFAAVLLGGAIFVIVTCAGLMIQAVNLQADLDRPQRHYWHQVPIEQTACQLNLAIPSKIVPGSPTSAMAWISSQTVTTTQMITISTHVPPPLFIKEPATVTLTVTVDSVTTPLRRFEYDSLDLETEERSIDLQFSVITDATLQPQVITTTSPLDTDYARKQIVVERVWWIVGIALAAALPVAVGALVAANK